MAEETSGHLSVDGIEIATRRVPGQGPGVIWLGGFRSDMTGTKAQALADWAGERGHEYLRFDYSGHGASGGAFEDGTISRWAKEARAVFDSTDGPQVLVGSSMGGWIALLLARALAAEGVKRLAALVLIAPAPDFTEALMWATFPEAVRKRSWPRAASSARRNMTAGPMSSPAR